MLIRISLIVAILAGLAVGALNFVKVKEKITTLTAERNEWHDKFDKTLASLNSTKKELDKTKTELATTTKNLETTTAERDKSVADLQVATRRVAQLTDDLEKTKSQLNDAQSKVAAYEASGLTPAQAVAAAKQIKELQIALSGSQGENVVLGKKIEKLTYQLSKYIGDTPPVYLPSTLVGKILTSDPKWDFVVLNIGDDQGAKEDGVLLVSRDGKLVAKIVIRSVEKNRCIANVIPGPSKLGEPMEGDLVFPANPNPGS